MSRSAVARDHAAERLELLDWKRRVFDLYRSIRADPDPTSAWDTWRDRRDEMISGHRQSPLDSRQRVGFTPGYYDCDPAARTLAEVVRVETAEANVPMSRAEGARFTHFGNAIFSLLGRESTLALHWLEGLRRRRVPLVHRRDQWRRDVCRRAESPRHRQGCGSGTVDGRLVLDFNFAFNPSCAYDSPWACPLAPPENRFPFDVRAGERKPAL